MTFFLLSLGALFVGYIVGYLSRWLLAFLGWGKSSCNIQKKGISGRFFGSFLFVIIAVYFQVPLLVFFAGFMLYESHNKWCIVRSIQK